jgi:hypothetical protein
MTRTDLALAGTGIIVAGILIAAAANRSAEAYSMSIRASCTATITAAAVIDLSGADCRPDGGYPPAIVALCERSGGRSARQIADSPQCREPQQ